MLKSRLPQGALETTVHREPWMARFDTTLQTRIHAPHRHTRDRTIAGLYQAYSGVRADEWDDDQRHAEKSVTKLCNCGRYAAVYQDPKTGEIIQSQALCKHRLCPKCNAIRSARMAGALDGHIEKLNSPRMLTLTLKHSDAHLKDQVKHLVESYRRLRRSNQYKAKIKGGVAVIEIKWSARDGCWHPHMHVLVDGAYWEQSQISKAWEIASKGSKIVDIRMIHDRAKASRYISKYVAKVGDIDGVPIERVAELGRALHGLRMVQTSGSLYGATSEKKHEKRDQPLEFVAPLGPVVEAANSGDEKAKSVLGALQQAIRGQRATGPDAVGEDDEQRSRQAARELWSWWHEQTTDTNHGNKPKPKNPRRIDRADNRAIWLWQEPEPGPRALEAGR